MEGSGVTGGGPGGDGDAGVGGVILLAEVHQVHVDVAHLTAG